MANTVNESAIKKLKLLFTVVDRNKAELYADVISQYDRSGGRGISRGISTRR